MSGTQIGRLGWWLVLVVVFAVIGAGTLTWPWQREDFHCELTFRPGVVLPGDLLGLKITSPQASRLYGVAIVTGQALDLDVRFFRVGPAFLALVGIPCDTPAGRYDLEIEVLLTSGEIYELFTVIEVGGREFPIQHLRAGPALTGLLTQANLVSDRARTGEARAGPTPSPLWEGPFLLPVQGRLTTDYGQMRYINQAPSGSPHSGLDIAAPAGTPVLAAAAGVVTFSGDLYVSGKTVILDHGLNLFSMYLHLSAALVEEGQEVERGEAIGLVGSTGFSTGPHLHWTVSLGLVPVNPWPLLDADPLTLFADPEEAAQPEEDSFVPGSSSSGCRAERPRFGRRAQLAHRKPPLGAAQGERGASVTTPSAYSGTTG